MPARCSLLTVLSRSLLVLPLLTGVVACEASSGSAAPPASPTAPATGSSPIDLTRARARVILSAATEWRAEHAAGACPTVPDLKAAGTLNALADDLDAWGRPFLIHCTPADTKVVSTGPDGLEANADDVESQPAPAPLSKAAPVQNDKREAITNDPTAPSFHTDDPIAARIHETIAARVHPRAKECFDHAPGGSAKGAVVGKIILAPDGTKKKGSLNSVGGCPAEVVSCVGRAIEAVTFEPTGDKVDRVIDFHYP